MRSARDIIDECVGAKSCSGEPFCAEALIEILGDNGYAIVRILKTMARPGEKMTATEAMSEFSQSVIMGSAFVLDGQTVKWDRNSGTDLAIEFDHGERLHIGGEPTEERVRLAIQAYRAGRNVGLGIGRDQVRAELRKVAGL